ncbi:hypothetical protein PR048_028043 [Dryococelus australis]|uniref:Uncharacterized protein n=1 Tax=Dryococelus australis TaxID=614101 RepID=A0ABQ9GI43_9NEOP|nr:hypothetical protein PR048_028043 [Dryococelus australis]
MLGWEKWEIPEKTRRSAGPSIITPKCEYPGVGPPGIEPGSPWVTTGGWINLSECFWTVLQAVFHFVWCNDPVPKLRE